ncbi:MAG: hypothetical protein HY289_14655 [Planctomycetes bacterium]|nr:hypothetical protein [Planctomycetota bacterium]
MPSSYHQLTEFLVKLGIEKVPHTEKTYLGHLVNVYRLMESEGCTEEICQAGMFHSIYGTQKFQGFKLELHQRIDVRALIGERAEKLAYLNCAMLRETFDEAAMGDGDTYHFTDRITGGPVDLSRADFDDLCRVHLYDWLEQAPRSRYGWGYRRPAYRRMAERLGGNALKAYDRVFATEPKEPVPA